MVTHTHHGDGAAEVQNPVLQCEVSPEVEVERGRAVDVIGLGGSVPGKEAGERVKPPAIARIFLGCVLS